MISWAIGLVIVEHKTDIYAILHNCYWLGYRGMTATAGTTFIYPFIPIDQLLWTIIYNSTILRQPFSTIQWNYANHSKQFWFDKIINKLRNLNNSVLINCFDRQVIERKVLICWTKTMAIAIFHCYCWLLNLLSSAKSTIGYSDK